MNGYCQLYTGDGKGKTTAAVGLAVRAAGAGLRVLFVQFMKTRLSGELGPLAKLGIDVRRFGTERFVTGEPTDGDIDLAAAGIACVREAFEHTTADMVIMDEAAIAQAMGLISLDTLLDLVDARPPGVELVITGRDAHPRLIERADLVTEMRKVKHYHNRGIPARPGIEV